MIVQWPRDRAGDAAIALAKAARIAPAGAAVKAPPTASLEAAAHAMGLEAEPLAIRYSDIDAVLRDAAPALLLVGPTENPSLVALVRVTRTRHPSAIVVAPDHSTRSVPLDDLRGWLYAEAERTYGARVDAILDRVTLPPRRRASARAALLREHVGARPLDAGWSLRISPAAPFFAQLRHARVSRLLFGMTLAHAASFGLTLLAWWVVGRAALTGHLEQGWLYAWALVLAVLVPIRVLTTWWQGIAGIGTGLLLKQRMLLGALKLDPEEIRHQGSGQLLGRVLEVDTVEELTMQGGFVSVVALVELAITIPVLAAGPSPTASIALLFVWMAFAALLAWRYAVRQLACSDARIAITNDLVEGMLGHRTRIAQELPDEWHVTEDRVLADYSEHARKLDRVSAWITGVLPRGWLLAGLAALGPAFTRSPVSPAELAVGVGGVLLARGALLRMTSGLTALIRAWTAWRHAGPLFRAAARPELALALDASRAESTSSDTLLLDAHNIVFRYRPEGEPILRGVNLRIHRRDRLLLEGPSGGGKSTLGSILAGLRAPESGLLLLSGLDRTTLGTNAWRRQIATAPQFHENHVLSDTFAFNLLMGRTWPPRPEDMREARLVCEELGLGPLLRRMPGGLMQRVGETGWQLSHGERSRLYAARALLQHADLVVLDESFAALDPETLALALRCVMRRAESLVVIAHP